MTQQFRIAPGTLASKLKQAWRFKTGKPILSSPVVDGAGRVFFGSEDKSVYAVRLADGKKLWSAPTNGAVGHGATGRKACGDWLLRCAALCI